MSEFLLNSTDKLSQIKGLQQILRASDPYFLPHAIRLSAASDREISDLALKVSLALSRFCLRDKAKLYPAPVVSAAVGLLRSKSPDFVRELNNQLNDVSSDTVIEAIMVLRHFLSAQNSEDLIRRFGKTGDARLRATVVRHIGPAAAERAPEMITRYLEDPDPRVRANAVEAIEAVGNKSSVRVLTRFKQDKNSRVRANTLKALYRLGDYGFINPLEEMVGALDPPAMRISAVWAIGEIARTNRSVLKLLTRVPDDPSPSLREQLKQVLRKNSQAPELDFLRTRLKDEIKSQIRINILKNADQFRIDQFNADRFILLTLGGNLTVDTMLPLKFRLQDIEKDKTTEILMDFRSVDYIDSSGAALLANFGKRLEQKGGCLILFGCNEKIREILHLTGIDTILKMFDTEQEARDFII
ncbi:MAG: HEAT repeat domain-containing protein [Fibrobacterota bacterium]